MDEEQGLASPIASGIRGIRRSVSSGVFTGRSVLPQPPQPDPVTTNLISQNSLALNTVSGQLTNISAQVSNLNVSLTALKENLELSESLDRQREAAKQRREAILAEQGLREGKESQLENKIQTALISPVRRIAQKTQGILTRLANFFFILLGGWLANTTLEFLSILSSKNLDKFNEFKRKLGVDLLTIGSIFLVATIGVKKLITLSAALAANAFRITFGAILAAPFNAVLLFLRNLVKTAKNTFLKNAGLIGKKAGPSLLTKTGATLLAAVPGGMALLNFGKKLFNRGKNVTGNVTGGVTSSTGAKVTGEVLEEGVKKTAKKGIFKGVFKGLFKGGVKGILKNMLGPVSNFLISLAFGEKLEDALTGAAGFAAGSAIIGKIASPLLLSPEPFTKILYGALVLGGGFLGEAGAKSLANAVMGFFGKKDKGNETSDSKTDTNQGAVTTESNVNETQIQQNDELEISGLTFGGSELIAAADNNRVMVEQNISSLEDAPPNIIDMSTPGGANMAMGSSGTSSSSSPTSSLPNIKSSDNSNPYLSYAESVYGVLG